MTIRSRTDAVNRLHEATESLDDDELDEMIRHLNDEARYRYARASEYYGIPCQEGKRRFDAYKEIRDALRDLRRRQSRR